MSDQNSLASAKATKIERALAYCRDVLGWKCAYVPPVSSQESLWLDTSKVYERKPEDFWDTPATFHVLQLEHEPHRSAEQRYHATAPTAAGSLSGSSAVV